MEQQQQQHIPNTLYNYSWIYISFRKTTKYLAHKYKWYHSI